MLKMTYVHTGETGTIIPVSRDHLAIWNERARTVRDLSRPVDFIVCTLDRALAPARQISRFYHTPHWLTSSAICVTVTRESSYLSPTTRNPNNIMSLHLATNHWFVGDSTNSCCSPVFEAK